MKTKYFFLALMLFVIIILFKYNFTIIKIHSSSMSPTLKDGEYVLLYLTNNIKNNDIVVFKLEDDFYIKRVVGSPKDKIQIIDKQLKRNDLIVKEIYINKDYDINYYENNKRFFTNNYIVPYKGFEIKLDSLNLKIYKQLINKIGDKNIFKNEKLQKYKFETDCLYLLGDNRNISKDSRYFGAIPKEFIIGKLLFY